MTEELGSKEPLLAVLLPNYNNAPYLKECFDSLANQSFTDFIVVFVDDCSTDDGVSIAKLETRFAITIIEHDSQKGIEAALNSGLEIINSEYFVRMDGDDIARSDRFEKLVRFMEKNSNFGICGSNIELFGAREGQMNYIDDPDLNKASLIFGHAVGHATCIFRTRILKENGIKYMSDFPRLEDYFLFFRLKDLTKASNINEPLYFYRQTIQNHNPELKLKMNESYKSIYGYVLKEFMGECNSEMLECHLSLANKHVANKKFSEYDDHCKALIQKNQEKNVFSENAFKQVIDKKLLSLIYRKIDDNTISFLTILKLNGRFHGIIKYYFSKFFK